MVLLGGDFYKRGNPVQDFRHKKLRPCRTLQ